MDEDTPTTTRKRRSHLSAGVRHTIYLDPEHKEDGWVEIEEMKEGKRAHFQAKTTNDIRVKKDSGDSAFQIDQGNERKWLMKLSITNWDLVDLDGKPIAFTPQNVEETLPLLDPSTVDHIVSRIREENSWMVDNEDPETIQDEIDSLHKKLEKAKEREEAKNS